MDFSTPLLEGKLVKRYKRFFADIVLPGGQEITAHCPNTGSMKSCGSPGDAVFVTPNSDPKRKLKYTWELTKSRAGFTCVNTSLPNKIVEEAITLGHIKELRGYPHLKREVKYGESSRIDIMLYGNDVADCYVEVKNVTLFDEGKFYFPDAVTTRGQKHLRELIKVVEEGKRAVMFFLVNRSESAKFFPAGHIDPDYAKVLVEAAHAGVEILAYQADISTKSITIHRKVEVCF